MYIYKRYWNEFISNSNSYSNNNIKKTLITLITSSNNNTYYIILFTYIKNVKRIKSK